MSVSTRTVCAASVRLAWPFKALADAGLTDVHLLPVFDLATVSEAKTDLTWAGGVITVGLAGSI